MQWNNPKVSKTEISQFLLITFSKIVEVNYQPEKIWRQFFAHDMRTHVICSNENAEHKKADACCWSYCRFQRHRFRCAFVSVDVDIDVAKNDHKTFFTTFISQIYALKISTYLEMYRHSHLQMPFSLLFTNLKWLIHKKLVKFIKIQLCKLTHVRIHSRSRFNNQCCHLVWTLSELYFKELPHNWEYCITFWNCYNPKHNLKK